MPEPGETQSQEVHSGSSNSASTSSLLVEFGVGRAVRANLRVLWPSGSPASVFNGVAVNQCVVIDETTGTLTGNAC